MCMITSYCEAFQDTLDLRSLRRVTIVFLKLVTAEKSPLDGKECKILREVSSLNSYYRFYHMSDIFT